MYTIHQFGHDSLESYYEYVSSKNYVDKIKVQTLFINFKDDPICDEKGIPISKIEQNENLVLLMTDKGGHLGNFECV